MSSQLGRFHPTAHKHLKGLPKVLDVPYAQKNGHILRLDVYGASTTKPLRPAILYIHGGGFSMFSKSTHWLMAVMFAQRGYVVFNIDYRLAPSSVYPAAIEDACSAYTWVVEHASRYGADPARIVLAGESAGGNLALGVALSACFRRDESFARPVLDSAHPPVAVLPACPLLEISSVDRYHPGLARPFERGVLRDVCYSYARFLEPHPIKPTLADPLLILESQDEPVRPLPPICSIVGDRDCLKDDVRRLGAALTRRQAPHETHVYPDAFHAFHAFPFLASARQCWRDQYAFLDRYAL
ncbi:MAG: alpha/beta hydrolase [Myxococcota bacterium]|nr:alpha/beta hydrolase [Myxococcota bacterium]